MSKDKNKPAAPAQEPAAPEQNKPAASQPEVVDTKPAAPAQEPAAENPSQQEKAKYIVSVEFGDIADFRKKHKVGADVSHFKADRLEHLVAVGCVEKQ